MKNFGIVFLIYAVIYLISILAIIKKIKKLEEDYKTKYREQRYFISKYEDLLNFIRLELKHWKSTQNTGTINKTVCKCISKIEKELSNNLEASDSSKQKIK